MTIFVQTLTGSVLLGTSFIDRFIKDIFSSEIKIVPFTSPPVSILMEHEAESEMTEEQQEDTITIIMAEKKNNQELV